MPSKTTSVLLGGVTIGVVAQLVALIPVAGGCLACLLYIAAGMLAVWHYTSTHGITLTNGQGAGMGALAGVIAGLFGALLSYVFVLAGLQPDPSAEAIRGMEESPNADQIPQGFIDFFEGGGVWVFAIVFGLIAGALLGAIGGAIGASMFKKGPDEPAL